MTQFGPTNFSSSPHYFSRGNRKRIGSNFTETETGENRGREKQGKREKENRGNRGLLCFTTKLPFFCTILNALFSEFLLLNFLLNSLVLGASITLEGADVGETLPYNHHHPFSSSSFSSPSNGLH